MAFSTTPTNGADRLRATADGQTINALGGNDWVLSNFDASTLLGGNGNDRLTAIVELPYAMQTDFSRSASLSGGNGNDLLLTRFTVQPSDYAEFKFTSYQSGGRGNDSIVVSVTTTSRDIYRPGSTDFDIYGGAGNDDIWVEVTGLDVVTQNFVDAGTGDDIVYIASPEAHETGYALNEVVAGDGDDDVLVLASTGWLADRTSETNISGGEGNDRLEVILTGASGCNNLDGGNGDDTIIITSSVGTETGGGVASVARGGAGNDAIILDSTSRGVFPGVWHTAYGDSGDDVITSVIDSGSSEEGELGTADARLYGGSGNDMLTASTTFGPHNQGEGGARLYGGTGNDTLRVYGGAENVLDGGSGRDTLIGGSGADRLIGGGGADRLTGGWGDDTFVFASVSGAATRTRDAILDFGNGADLIDVSGIDADISAAGNQAFTFGTDTGVGSLWIEDVGPTALAKANNGGPELLVIAVRDAAHREWTAADFIL